MFISTDITGPLSANMYAYCENNPVSGYDPCGDVNWGGVIAGLGIIAGTAIAIATFGIGTGIGAIVMAAAMATGATMTYAAATESAMVVDVSGSYQTKLGGYGKAGVSIIVDFSDDGGIYGYSHLGGGYGYSNGISYSVGLVDNMNDPTDYSKHFVDVNVGNTVGLDHCFDPTREYSNTTKATTITFGKGSNHGMGYDYYSQPWIVKEWGAIA